MTYLMAVGGWKSPASRLLVRPIRGRGPGYRGDAAPAGAMSPKRYQKLGVKEQDDEQSQMAWSVVIPTTRNAVGWHHYKGFSGWHALVTPTRTLCDLPVPQPGVLVVQHYETVTCQSASPEADP